MILTDAERITQLEDILVRERRAAALEQDRLLTEIRVHQVRADQFKRERDEARRKVPKS